MRHSIILALLIAIAIPFSVEAQNRSKKERKTHLILSTIKGYLGTPYKYGGMSKSGMDCSGLLHVGFNTGGVRLPRTAQDQSKHGKKIGWNRVRPGDLVFFKFKQKGEKWWHSGVITIVEENRIRFIHASSSRGVVESDLLSDYYRKKVKGFRRVI